MIGLANGLETQQIRKLRRAIANQIKPRHTEGNVKLKNVEKG